MLDTVKTHGARLLMAVLVIGLGATGSSFSAEECTAKIKPELYRTTRADGRVVHRFKVDVSADARCANVDYELVIVEETSGGEKETKTKSLRTRVRDRVVTSAMHEHKMSEKDSMTSWKIELRGCTPCGAGITD